MPIETRVDIEIAPKQIKKWPNFICHKNYVTIALQNHICSCMVYIFWREHRVDYKVLLHLAVEIWRREPWTYSSEHPVIIQFYDYLVANGGK